MTTLPGKFIAMFLAIAFTFGLSACSDQSQMEGAAEQPAEEAVSEPATDGETTKTE